MKPFANAFGRIGTENAFVVSPEITGWEKKGFDIVKLNIGEPGGNMPEESTKAVISSIKDHETHYMSSAGTDALRKEVASYMAATRGVNYKLNDIIMTPGGKPVIAGTIFILVNPGDEVIYPTPGYPIYESIIDFVGAERKPIALKEEKDFRFDINDLKKLVSRKTKLLILNSPSNPTGGVLEEDDIKEIAALSQKYDFYILSDECYSRFAFSNKFKKVTFKGNKLVITPSIVSQKGMEEKVVVLDAFSKTYAMTGLRVGWAASKNREFMSKFLTYAINFWSCLPAPIMAGALAALGKDQSFAQKEIADYRKKRDVAFSMLREIKNIKCNNPTGSFYLFPNVTAVCRKLKLKDAEEFRKYLLSYDKKNKKGVAVLARTHFGKRLPEEKEEYVRISIAGKMEDIKEGIRRIKEAVS